MLPGGDIMLVSGYLPREAVRASLSRADGLRALDLQGRLDEGYGAEVVFGPGLDLDRFGPLHRVAVATLGAAGAEAVCGGERARAEPAVTRPDELVGAGDAFAAAFLLALAGGAPLADCLARGCRAGSAA